MQKQTLDNEKRIAQKQYDAYKEAYNKVSDIILDRKEKEKAAIEEVHEARIKAINDELEAVERSYRRRLEYLDDMKSEEDYQRGLGSENQIANEIQAQINALSMDSSLEAQAQRKELQRKLNEQLAKIDEMRRRHEFEETKNALQKDLETQREHFEELEERENEHFDYQNKLLDDRYTEQKIHEEAEYALKTGYLRMFNDAAVKTYDNIASEGVLSSKTLADAYRQFAVETGEAFDDLAFNHMNNLLKITPKLMSELKEVLSLLKSVDEYNLATSSRYQTSSTSGATERPDGYDVSTYGNDGKETYAGETASKNQQLKNDYAFVLEEIERTLEVIPNRVAAGLDTELQEKYLKKLTELRLAHEANPKQFHTGTPGVELKSDEVLAKILRNETVLPVDAMRSLLGQIKFTDDAVKAMQSSILSSFAFMSNIPKYEMSTGNSPMINIEGGLVNIAGNADPNKVKRAATAAVEQVASVLNRRDKDG